MQLFENTIKLRGFLGKDAEVPSSEGITDDALAVLSLHRYHACGSRRQRMDFASRMASHHLPRAVLLRLHARHEARRLCRDRR